MSSEACADFWRWCATVPVIGFTFAVAGLSGCGVIGRPQAVTTSNSDTLFSTVAGEDYGYKIVAAKSDDSAGEWTFALKSQRPPKDNNLRFEWEIDGQAYQGLAVSHIFSETGTFVISVRAIEPNGNDVFVLTLEIQIELPPPPNQAPIAVALAVSKDGRVVVRDGGEGEQVLAVYENEQVFLDGSESYDPDGDDTSFEWAQVTGNAIHLVQLVDASAAVASFVTPTVDGDARLAFTLIVSDGQRNTEVIVPVDVLNIVEIVGAGPEADAGEPQEVTEGDLVTLDGSNSKGSGTGELRFHWAQTCGPLVVLINASQTMAAFNAPTIELESETLCFELTVSQDDLAASDEVRITILPAEPPGGEPPPDTPPCDDEDGDAICRHVDNCPSHSNSDQADDDLDGLGNVCDGCPNDPANDIDDDGHCGDVDNCPLAGNASQADSDGDGIGDACDDSDGDGVLDTEDNCPAVANANQADSDGDGVGDVCESEPSECKTGSSDWQNALFEQEQTGTFDVEFYATPGAAPVDAIVALSSGEGSDFSHYAVLVRFNLAGTIDVRNGGSYASDNTIRYTAGREYRFRLVVNVPLKIYSVFVTPPEPDEDEIVLATNYAFRSDQSNVAALDHWGLWADLGTHDVCDLTVSTPPPDTDPPSVPTGLSGTPVSSSQISLAWTRSTDNVAVAGYKIFRNSDQITSVSTASYHNFGLTPATQYSYTVSAYDAVGNESAQSPPVEVTTPDQEPPDETCDYVIYPHESINKYSSIAQSGQTVCVSAGTYYETLTPAKSGTLGAPIIFRNYPGATPVIDGQQTRLFNVDINGKSYIRIEGFEITDAAMHGIYIDNNNTGNVILGNRLYKNSDPDQSVNRQWAAIYVLLSTDLVIQNNEIDNNWENGILILGGYGYGNDGLRILGNHIHENGIDAIKGGGGDDWLIEGNTIHDHTHQKAGAHPDGTHIQYGVRGLVIRNNVFYNQPQNIMLANDLGPHVWEDVQIYGNLVYITDDFTLTPWPKGIFVEGGFPGGTYTNVTVYNNTVVNCYYGILIRDRPGGGSILGHLDLANNIVSDAHLALLVEAYWAESVTMDYDLIWAGSDSGWISFNGTTYSTLDAFRAANPGLEVNGIAQNPAFAGSPSHNYRLQASSAARNGGGAVTGVVTDLDGVARPQEGAFDMGAYEFQAK